MAIYSINANDISCISHISQAHFPTLIIIISIVMEAQSYWVTEAPLCTTPYACHERLAVPIYNRRQQGKNVLTVSSLWSGEVLLMGHSLSGHCRWDLKAKCWWTTLIALWKQILSIAKSERKAELVGKLFNNIVLTRRTVDGAARMSHECLVVEVVGAHHAVTHCHGWTWSAEAPLLCHSQCSSLCTDRAGERGSFFCWDCREGCYHDLAFLWLLF